MSIEFQKNLNIFSGPNHISHVPVDCLERWVVKVDILNEQRLLEFSFLMLTKNKTIFPEFALNEKILFFFLLVSMSAGICVLCWLDKVKAGRMSAADVLK